MRHLLYLPTITMGLVLSIASPNSGIADTAFLEKAVRDKVSSIEGRLIAWRRDIYHSPQDDPSQRVWADDEIRLFHFPVHGIEERFHPGRNACVPIAPPDQFHIAFSCLVREVHAAIGCQPRRRFHHGHIDRVRALGAAKD